MIKYFFKYTSVLLLLLLLIPNIALGGKIDEETIKKALPGLLGANNVGNDFWFSAPPCYEDESGGYANYVKIFVTSAVATQVTVEIPGLGFYATKMTVPNDIIEFNLEPARAQPTLFSGRTNYPFPEAIYPGRGVHVYAKDQLVIYVMVRYRYTSDGWLLYPVSALGKEYIISSYPDMVGMYPWARSFPSITNIVAAYDNTTVTFTMGGNVISKTAGGLTPGKSVTKKLQKGDVWMFMSAGAEQDLTGSKVVSSLPVAIVSGVHCANVPTDNRWCDYIAEMEIPTFTWGKNVHVPRVKGRKHNSIIRVFAKEPNTKVFRNGKQVTVIPQAGGVIGKGYQEMRITPYEETPRSAVYSGDKPISVTLYNTGVEEDMPQTINSDPFQMGITPYEQYQKEITFCTPGVRGGLSYPENYLNLVYQTDESGLVPDDLEYAEVHSGQFSWYKIRTKFPASDEMFTYDIDGKKFAVKVVTLPYADGVYKIRANTPFAAYSYGYSSYDSYGYPTSAALADLEKPDTVPPVPVWNIDCFGNIEGATITDMPEDSKIRSNLAKIIFIPDLSFNFDFNYKEFVPGESRSTTWSLNVIDPQQDAKAVISFVDRRGNDTTITIEYFAVAVEVIPDNWDYGTLLRGTSDTHKFILKNKSTRGPVTIKLIEFKQNNQNFEFVDLKPPFPWILGAQEEKEFTVQFNAVKDGEFADSIRVYDTCFWWNKAYVKAKVTAPQILVDDAFFDPIPVGVTVKKDAKIYNPGDFNLTVTGYTGPVNKKVYALDKLDAGVFPIVIEPKGSYSFVVKFTPDDTLKYPDKVIFSSNAIITDSICLLDGKGIKADFFANSYDWHERRIHRPGTFPMGPYPVDAGDDPAIVITNSGNIPVVIENATIVVDQGQLSSFNVKATDFIGKSIPAKGSLHIPVTFQPTTVGPHQITIKYVNSAGVEGIQSVLKGVGILGTLITEDMDFGTTIVGDKANAKKRTIKISNNSRLDQSNNIFGDVVTLTKVDILPDNTSISTDGTWDPNSEGFYFKIDEMRHSSKGVVALPFDLKTEEYVEIDAEFVATRVGSHSAQIRTISDAENDVTSNWTGNGVSQGVAITGGTAKVCTGEPATITCEIINAGSGTIKVTSLRMEPQLSQFYFANSTDQNGFDIPENKSRKFDIVFVSTNAMPRTVVKVIATTDVKEYDIIDTEIAAEAVHFTRQTSNAVSDSKLIINEPFSYSIRLEPGDDMQMAAVNEIEIRVKYEKEFIAFLPDQAFNSFPDKWDMIVRAGEYDKQNNSINISLKAKGSYLFNESIELVRLGFRAFLPYTSDENTSITGDSIARISYTLAAIGNMCADFTTDSLQVKLEPTCVRDLRNVFISSSGMALYEIAPNPVDSRGAEIKFAVAFDNVTTEISIINSSGEVVAVPVRGILSPQGYAVPVPIDQLPSGVYIVRMKSGAFLDQTNLVVRK